jgi:hypothetical protein
MNIKTERIIKIFGKKEISESSVFLLQNKYTYQWPPEEQIRRCNRRVLQ